MEIPGFDPSTMTYFATQIAHPGGGTDPFQNMLMPTDLQPDRQSAYGGYGSDDLNFHSLQPSHPPLLKRFSSAYEDPFSDVVSAFDQPLNQDQLEPPDQLDPETPSIERDNKLLGFSLPAFDYTLLDYTYRRTTISLSAQLHGMFFLAESPWAAAGDAQPPPSELTCYRRNLFQITGEVTAPRTLRYLMTEQGEQIPILGQELQLSATESTEGNTVKIISVPWKTLANPGAAQVEDKVEREPPPIPLDLMNVQETESDFTTFPFQFQWKRLQFRIATANNGRRKELQQHFVVRLKVVATLGTGGKIPICEVQSGAIIVRGRSPRNFQTRKDMPLNGSGHVRKTSQLPGIPSRTNSGEGAKKIANDGPTSAPIKADPNPPMVNMQSYFDMPRDPTPADYYDWRGPSPGHGAMTAIPQHTSPFDGGGGIAAYASSSPDLLRTRPFVSQQPPAAPINLSLVEEDPINNSPPNNNLGRLSATPPAGAAAKKIFLPPRPPSFSINTVNSPDESADLLYEYFPLGLDDWMPPVDAVYRPHVVHHTKLPSDPRDPKTSGRGPKGRSKRYFSEDVS